MLLVVFLCQSTVLLKAAESMRFTSIPTPSSIPTDLIDSDSEFDSGLICVSSSSSIPIPANCERGEDGRAGGLPPPTSTLTPPLAVSRNRYGSELIDSLSSSIPSSIPVVIF